MKVARISTVMFFLRTQLKKQIDDLVDFGCDVTIIANEDKSVKLENVKTISLDIKRENFDIVHSTLT